MSLIFTDRQLKKGWYEGHKNKASNEQINTLSLYIFSAPQIYIEPACGKLNWYINRLHKNPKSNLIIFRMVKW